MHLNETASDSLDAQLTTIIAQWEIQLTHSNIYIDTPTSIYIQNLLARIVSKISDHARQHQEKLREALQERNGLLEGKQQLVFRMESVWREKQEMRGQLQSLCNETISRQNQWFNELQMSKEQMQRMKDCLSQYQYQKQQQNKILDHEQRTLTHLRAHNQSLAQRLQHEQHSRLDIEGKYEALMERYEGLSQVVRSREEASRSLLEREVGSRLNQIVEESQLMENSSPIKVQSGNQYTSSKSQSAHSYASKKILAHEDPEINFQANSSLSGQLLSQRKDCVGPRQVKKGRNELISAHKVYNKSLNIKNKWSSSHNHKKGLLKPGLSQKRQNIHSFVNVSEHHANKAITSQLNVIFKDRLKYKMASDNKCEGRMEDVNKRLRLREQQIKALQVKIRALSIQNGDLKKNGGDVLKVEKVNNGKRQKCEQVQSSSAIKLIRCLQQQNGFLKVELQQMKEKCWFWRQELKKLSQKYALKNAESMVLCDQISEYECWLMEDNKQEGLEVSMLNEEQGWKQNDFQNLSQKLDDLVKLNNHGSYHHSFQASFKSALDLQQQPLKHIDQIDAPRQYLSVQNSHILQNNTSRYMRDEIKTQQNLQELDFNNDMEFDQRCLQDKKLWLVQSDDFNAGQSHAQRALLSELLTQRKIAELSIVSQGCLQIISCRSREMTLQTIYSIQIYPNRQTATKQIALQSNLCEVLIKPHIRVQLGHHCGVFPPFYNINTIQPSNSPQKYPFSPLSAATQTIISLKQTTSSQTHSKSQAQTIFNPLSYSSLSIFHQKIEKSHLELSHSIVLCVQVCVNPVSPCCSMGKDFQMVGRVGYRNQGKEMISRIIDWCYAGAVKCDVSMNTQTAPSISDQTTITDNNNRIISHCLSLTINNTYPDQTLTHHSPFTTPTPLQDTTHQPNIEHPFAYNQQVNVVESFNGQGRPSWTMQTQQKASQSRLKQQVLVNKWSQSALQMGFEQFDTKVTNTAIHSPLNESKQMKQYSSQQGRQISYQGQIFSQGEIPSQGKLSIIKKYLYWIKGLSKTRVIVYQGKKSFVPLEAEYSRHIYEYRVVKEDKVETLIVFEGKIILIKQEGKDCSIAIKNMKKEHIKFNKSSLVIGNSQILILNNTFQINRRNKFKMFKGDVQDGEWRIDMLVMYEVC